MLSFVSSSVISSSPLVGDAITSLSHSGVGWDRFGWQIKLEDVTERRLAEKTMYLVARYTAQGEGGGEWWDNNAGANYRVVFKKEPFVPSRVRSVSQIDMCDLLTQRLSLELARTAVAHDFVHDAPAR